MPILNDGVVARVETGDFWPISVVRKERISLKIVPDETEYATGKDHVIHVYNKSSVSLKIKQSILW